MGDVPHIGGVRCRSGIWRDGRCGCYFARSSPGHPGTPSRGFSTLSGLSFSAHQIEPQSTLGSDLFRPRKIQALGRTETTSQQNMSGRLHLPSPERRSPAGYTANAIRHLALKTVIVPTRPSDGNDDSPRGTVLPNWFWWYCASLPRSGTN